MQAIDIFERLKNEFGDEIISLTEDKSVDSFITIDAAGILEICLFLRDEKDMMFDYMVNLTGMDNGKTLGVVYHLYSVSLNHRIVLKVELDRVEPRVPTVERVWKTANWHEREAYDMYGVIFHGHPNLIRILCPYDWEGFPLRKDYQTPDFYHGMKVPF